MLKLLAQWILRKEFRQMLDELQKVEHELLRIQRERHGMGDNLQKLKCQMLRLEKRLPMASNCEGESK